MEVFFSFPKFMESFSLKILSLMKISQPNRL